jgi:hypothetical protein
VTNQDINALLSNLEALQLVEIQELEELCAKFPYFQSLRFLLVKKHVQVNSNSYEHPLNMAATYATNRKFLYDFLYEIQSPLLDDGEEDADADNAPQDIDFEIVTDHHEEVPIFSYSEEDDLESDYEGEEEDNHFIINGDIDDDLPEWIDEELEEEHAISDEYSPQAPSIEEDVDQRVQNILSQISSDDTDRKLEEAIFRIRNMKLGNPSKPNNQRTPLTEEQKIFQLHSELEELKDGGLETQDLLGSYPEKILKETSFTFLDTDPSEEELEETENTQIEQLRAAMRRKYVERLRQSVEAYFNLEQETLKEANEQTFLEEIPNDMSFKEWMKSLKKTANEPVVEPETVEELVEHSLDEDDDLMSEALAELLASQGNKQRAIEMYEQLIIKFPEKKTFFALKIKDLN